MTADLLKLTANSQQQRNPQQLATAAPEDSQQTYASFTVKKANDFPVPSRDVTNQTLPVRDFLFNYSPPVVVVVVGKSK
jgi:hypothetical protein